MPLRERQPAQYRSHKGCLHSPLKSLKLPANLVRLQRSKFHFIHGAMYGNHLCVVPNFASSTLYMVPYMEVTRACFRTSQVPLHTWCHVWKSHVRRSEFRKFHFIHGAIYGSYTCVLPYFPSITSYMVPYMVPHQGATPIYGTKYPIYGTI